MTHNPKTPWPARSRQAPDRQHPRDAFVDRLRRLGAADDVLDAVANGWDDLEWEDRDEWVAMSDEALAAELASIEREHWEGTHDEDDEAAEQLAALLAQAEVIVAEVVAVVTAWVDGDPEAGDDTSHDAVWARAWAVDQAERLRADGPRKGVLGHVAEVLEEAGQTDA